MVGDAKRRREKIKKRFPDIEFWTLNGNRIKLSFAQREYKAYIYDSGKWTEMYLGSRKTDALIEYIKERY